MGCEKISIDAWIETQGGHQIFFNNPEKSGIDIADIARALSRIPRFVGHTREFCSVAQHCVLASYLCRNKMWALMHEAAEAFMGDIPGPLKRMFPDLCALERRLLSAVADKFELHVDVKQEEDDEYTDVRRAAGCTSILWDKLRKGCLSRDKGSLYPLDVEMVDLMLLVTEHEQLFESPREWEWASDIPFVRDSSDPCYPIQIIVPWSREKAEIAFLARYAALDPKWPTKITASPWELASQALNVFEEFCQEKGLKLLTASERVDCLHNFYDAVSKSPI